MERELEFAQECPNCKGTGLYSGMGERDGFAVQCHTCDGTGCKHTVVKWKDFKGRNDSRGIVRVLEWNPGICAGTGGGHSMDDFGGISYKEWAKGLGFPPKTEMRKFVCPAWWYQSVNYKKKPDCVDMIGIEFSSCIKFGEKEECWKKWDVGFAK